MANYTLVDEWNALTKREMPDVAKARGWPVHLDHCFQRILLDNAVGTKWRDVIASPAYRNASDTQLARAIEIGRAAVSGEESLEELNINSLKWRGKL